MPPFDIDAIASQKIISNLHLSNDGRQLVYQSSFLYSRAGENDTSALWVAETEYDNSSRQLTSGSYNDIQPRFLPDGTHLLFLSDRHKSGGRLQIYMVPLDTQGEAIPLTNTGNKNGISSFLISPDGRYIAYLSEDEPTVEDDRKERERTTRLSGENSMVSRDSDCYFSLPEEPQN